MRVLLALAATGLLLACGASEPGGGEAPAADAAASVAPAAPSSPPPGAEAPGEPGPGGARVAFDGDHVSVVASDAPLSQLLREIAAETGLALDVGDAGIEDRRITARIEDASLYDVLALVLRDVDYSLDVAFEPAFQRHRIATLRIGSQRAGRGRGPDPLAEALFALLDSPDPEVVMAALDALARAGQVDAVAEIEPLLDDADPEVRDAAASALDALEPLEDGPS